MLMTQLLGNYNLWHMQMVFLWNFDKIDLKMSAFHDVRKTVAFFRCPHDFLNGLFSAGSSIIFSTFEGTPNHSIYVKIFKSTNVDIFHWKATVLVHLTYWCATTKCIAYKHLNQSQYIHIIPQSVTSHRTFTFSHLLSFSIDIQV